MTKLEAEISCLSIPGPTYFVREGNRLCRMLISGSNPWMNQSLIVNVFGCNEHDIAMDDWIKEE